MVYEDFGKANIMVCSGCGAILGTKENGQFDIWDCGWTCPKCKEYWHLSDTWIEIGNLLIPFSYKRTK